MSEEQLEYDPEWTLATLNDAKEALEDLIAQVEDSPEEVKEILEENIANVYAKLNYAFNSAKDGPDALLSMPADELVAFPCSDIKYGRPHNNTEHKAQFNRPGIRHLRPVTIVLNN